MNNIHKTLFISDLHLDEKQPRITELFLGFLKRDLQNVSALYILGDLFEAWVGDDDLTVFHKRIIQALREVTLKGLPVYVAQGNRDFLLGEAFARATGCRLLTDETVIDLYGTRILLMHGDKLCTNDINYIRLRKILRNRTLQKIFLALPLRLRRKIAKLMRTKSSRDTQCKSLDMMDVNEAEVQRVLHRYDVQLVIHGHTHKPGIHAKRIVLGAWHSQGNKLECDERGNRNLLDFGL